MVLNFCCFCSGVSLNQLLRVDLTASGALGIAQIALATNQEGAAGGIDAAISWGVGTVTGIGAAALITNIPLTSWCNAMNFTEKIEKELIEQK
jgi:hypothetical protein